MQIQVNSDRSIGGDSSTAAEVSGNVESSLSRYSGRITRVEVHLSDENSGAKGGTDDMRCLLEARLEGRGPIAVTHRAATLGEAVGGAADKLARMLDSTLGRLDALRRPPRMPSPSPERNLDRD